MKLHAINTEKVIDLKISKNGLNFMCENSTFFSNPVTIYG